MIAAWMLYSAIWGLWIAAIAWGTERVMLSGRGPARFVWLVAIVLSIAAPAVAYVAPRNVIARVESPGFVVIGTSRTIASGGNPRRVQRIETGLRIPTIATVVQAASRANRPLGIAWLAFSLGMLAYLGGGALRLRLLRRRWHARVVEGTSVLVSDDTGPALVGVLRSTIVVPVWALSLDQDALALMLRHEAEHRAAGDTRTLALAQTLVALMPWNPMLWWQMRRLRLAVEMDCDARVLRGATDVASYGRLLLEFGRGPRAVRFAGVALASHASNLEARIRRMTQRARITRARAMTLSVAGGAVAIVVGCQLPAPAPEAKAPEPPRPAVVASAAADSAPRTLQRDTARPRLSERRDSAVAHDYMRVQLDSIARVRLNDSTLNQSFKEMRLVMDSSSSLMRSLADAQRMLDSMPSGLAQHRALMDSLARLRWVYTEEHPAVRRILRQLAERSWMDSVSAGPGPWCTAGNNANGPAIIKIVVADSAAAGGGRVGFTSTPSTGRGTTVEYDPPGMTCSSMVGGEIRLALRDAHDPTPIVMRSDRPTSVVVVTPSGRALAGPIDLRNEARSYQLTWPPR